MTRPSTPERRRSRRSQTVRTLQAHLSLEADIVSLSSSGMMVRLPFPPDLGSRHGFSLSVDGEPFDVLGIVRNVAPQDDAGEVFHVGVEFTELTSAQQKALQRYVAKKLKPA
jgi:hypothetical protein